MIVEPMDIVFILLGVMCNFTNTFLLEFHNEIEGMHDVKIVDAPDATVVYFDAGVGSEDRTAVR